MLASCTEYADPRPCAKCSELGHFVKQYPNRSTRRLNWTVPAKAQKTAIKPTNLKLDYSIRVADTFAIVQWDTVVLEQIEKNDKKVDPAGLADSIAA